MLKALGAAVLLALLVLVGMNFLVVSNAGDRVRALQAEVDELRRQQATGGGDAARTPFDVETSTAFSGEGSGEGPAIALADRPLREVVVGLTETIDADGKRQPVVGGAVVLLPGVPGFVPLGRDAGCSPVPGVPLPGWVLTLDGGTLRVASRGCAYPRPLRARLRGLITR